MLSLAEVLTLKVGTKVKIQQPCLVTKLCGRNNWSTGSKHYNSLHNGIELPEGIIGIIKRPYCSTWTENITRFAIVFYRKDNDKQLLKQQIYLPLWASEFEQLALELA